MFSCTLSGFTTFSKELQGACDQPIGFARFYSIFITSSYASMEANIFEVCKATHLCQKTELKEPTLVFQGQVKFDSNNDRISKLEVRQIQGKSIE